MENFDNSYKPYTENFSSGEHYAAYEYQITKDFVIPLLDRWKVDLNKRTILDLGCGAGGMVLAFSERGSICTGVDQNFDFIKEATNNASKHCPQLKFIEADILKLEDFDNYFDLIILSEVLEHLYNKENIEKIIIWCKKQLSPDGRIYVSFPPWLNPFGGHQAGWRYIHFIPWFHLFPDVIKRILVPKYSDRYINFSRELNRLTITYFERLLQKNEIHIIRKELFHFRPEYKYRYGVPTIRVLPFIELVPVVREISTTGAFYLLGR